MTAGARLRGKAVSGFLRRGRRGRARTPADEEAAALLEPPERGAEGRAGARGARAVHLAALPERYEPLEEPAPGGRPARRYRQKLKKCGKNIGKVVIKGCRYVVLGLQGFAAAYSAPFGVATSVVSFVR